MVLRPAWSAQWTLGCPELHCETLSQGEKEAGEKGKEEKGQNPVHQQRTACHHHVVPCSHWRRKKWGPTLCPCTLGVTRGIFLSKKTRCSA